MGEWKLMPRQGKPDKFTIMRGVTASSIGGDNVLNLKADTKDAGAAWIDELQKAQVKLALPCFRPTPVFISFLSFAVNFNSIHIVSQSKTSTSPSCFAHCRPCALSTRPFP